MNHGMNNLPEAACLRILSMYELTNASGNRDSEQLDFGFPLWKPSTRAQEQQASTGSWGAQEEPGQFQARVPSDLDQKTTNWPAQERHFWIGFLHCPRKRPAFFVPGVSERRSGQSLWVT